MFDKALLALAVSLLLFISSPGVTALELPSAGKANTHSSELPDYRADEIARRIRNNHNWQILDWKQKVLDSRKVYRFKLLNRKKGRVEVIEIDPTQPALDTLNR